MRTLRVDASVKLRCRDLWVWEYWQWPLAELEKDYHIVQRYLLKTAHRLLEKEFLPKSLCDETVDYQYVGSRHDWCSSRRHLPREDGTRLWWQGPVDCQRPVRFNPTPRTLAPLHKEISVGLQGPTGIGIVAVVENRNNILYRSIVPTAASPETKSASHITPAARDVVIIMASS